MPEGETSACRTFDFPNGDRAHLILKKRFSDRILLSVLILPKKTVVMMDGYLAFQGIPNFPSHLDVEFDVALDTQLSAHDVYAQFKALSGDRAASKVSFQGVNERIQYKNVLVNFDDSERPSMTIQGSPAGEFSSVSFESKGSNWSLGNVELGVNGVLISSSSVMYTQADLNGMTAPLEINLILLETGQLHLLPLFKDSNAVVLHDATFWNWISYESCVITTPNHHFNPLPPYIESDGLSPVELTPLETRGVIRQKYNDGTLVTLREYNPQENTYRATFEKPDGCVHYASGVKTEDATTVSFSTFDYQALPGKDSVRYYFGKIVCNGSLIPGYNYSVNLLSLFNQAQSGATFVVPVEESVWGMLDNYFVLDPSQLV